MNDHNDKQEKAKSLNRRTLLRSAVGLGCVAAAVALRPGAEGKNHTPYFQQLSQALDKAQLSTPRLIIDKNILRSNIKTLKQHLQADTNYRIVAKSLPSIELLKFIMQEAQTNRLMVFHQPFLNQLAQQLPQADILLGKPMPIQAARNFYQQWQASSQQQRFNPAQQLQWLIDTPQRLQQYQQLAQTIQQPLLINIELDIGLHRGGVNKLDTLRHMLEHIQASKWLTFSGLMGYEPHIAKVPGRLEALKDSAMQRYQQAVDLALQISGKRPEQLTLNCGGSPTYQLYQQGQYPFNELSAGSCLVKPVDFDTPQLQDHQAAAFIATPVLKSLPETQLPVPYLASVMRAWNPNYQQSFFTYGGYWKAQPHSPQGLTLNPIMGRSTNQELYNGSENIQLGADDWLFLRPQQSEFVFLQFGDIAVYENGQIQQYWPVMAAS